MTIEELYAYGKESKPARACIPKELVQSLPRLEKRGERILVRFWYYFCNASYHWEEDNPLYCAAYDIYADKLVELKALTDAHEFMQSWQDLIVWSRDMREVKYLEHCVMLLNRGNITQEEIIHTQALWLNAQTKGRFFQMYTSDVCPEAREKLLHPEMAENSKYLLQIWGAELDQYWIRNAEGLEKLKEIWNDPVFQKERAVYYHFLNY